MWLIPHFPVAEGWCSKEDQLLQSSLRPERCWPSHASLSHWRGHSLECFSPPCVSARKENSGYFAEASFLRSSSCVLLADSPPSPASCPLLLLHPSAPTASETDIQVVSFTDHTFSRCLGYWQRPNLITGELYMFLLLVEWPATTELPFYLIYNLRHDLNVQSIFFHKPSS